MWLLDVPRVKVFLCMGSIYAFLNNYVFAYGGRSPRVQQIVETFGLGNLVERLGGIRNFGRSSRIIISSFKTGLPICLNLTLLIFNNLA
jgi:hypothetical protein